MSQNNKTSQHGVDNEELSPCILNIDSTTATIDIECDRQPEITCVSLLNMMVTPFFVFAFICICLVFIIAMFGSVVEVLSMPDSPNSGLVSNDATPPAGLYP
ncbi:hypothetical protein NEDG_00071 [Nematocida displodere]|uniref:Uncharacterized protein n=1 Tax=Nematocida displodere TaxID=1805483 RepID=A0A177EIP5_9MICR|nr:hypothetical protein NEDG_00071 [Nematocida displodere]